MNIIYLGDREAGKTTLAAQLARNEGIRVHTQDPDAEVLSLASATSYQATGVWRSRTLKLQVSLPSAYKSLDVQWIDTPGEAWRKRWQINAPEEWKKILTKVNDSAGIFVVIPPYREIVKLDQQQAESFVTRNQWCNRFHRWVEFFRRDCSKVRHLVLCLNKADLFCEDLEREGRRLGFSEKGGSMNWMERNQYVTSTYFAPIQDQIAELNHSMDGLAARCFISSRINRPLLELPWIYLASYLGH